MKAIFTKSISVVALATTLNLNATEPVLKSGGISFTENKGQICDQNFKPRPDVLFSGSADGLVYHLTNTGISYQLSKIESWKEITEEKTKTKLKAPDITSIYRIDVKWMGINEDAKIEKGNPLEGESNYYLQQCPNGALNVKSYSEITYKSIYKGIDLKWYEREGNLEYDFIVSPNADPGKIKLQINGAKKLSINEKGELEITTPLGKITEKAPVAYQNGKRIEASWQLKNNELQFSISSYDHNKTLTIDPMVRLWGTYYGGTVSDRIRDVTTDANNNSYVVGFTSSTTAGTIIATSGAFQTTHAGGPAPFDAFVAKFNPSGVRQWATFYGGTGDDFGMANAVDGLATPNLYLTGYTNSSALATAGAHQTSKFGVYDAFIVQFNSLTGARTWCTYYGSTNSDYGNDCATDGANNLIVVGTTSIAPTSTLIATPGSHQAATGANNDGFIVKFNSSGVRQWGSYYGGTTNEYVYGCDVNKTTNDIAFVGYSSGSTSGIVTAGAYQTSGANSFIVKFNQSGVRQWGTYYAGANDDIYSCAINNAGEVYAVGTDTNPSTGLGSAGSHQSITGGGTADAFLVKMSSNGATRLWGTYYGGSNADEAIACNLDNSGNIYMAGYTMSSGNISSFSSHQTTFGGGSVNDAFIAGFNPSGVRLFGSYYGGALTDYGWSCKPDGAGNVYLAGSTNENGTTNIISTASGHQSVYGAGVDDGFLAKFSACQNLSLNIAGGTTTLCAGSTTLSASGSGFTSYSWTPTGATTASITISPTITTTYTLVANTATPGCVYMDVHTVTAGITPTLTATAATPTVCSGAGTSFLSASGASTYSWSTGATTSTISVIPPTTTTYTVTGFINACSTSVTVTQTVIPLPTATITASSNTLCAGGSVTMTASGTASSYTWTGGNTNTVIVVSPTVTTSYILFGSNSTGCTGFDTHTITVTPSPTVNATASTASICSGSSTSVTLTATGAATYSWNTGPTTATIAVTPTATTTYSVVGTNTLGCSRTRTINVVVNNTPTVVVSNYTICPGGTATLVASGATTYSWNTGATAATTTVAPSSNTNYTVTGTSFGTCTDTKTLNVTVGSAISILLSPSPSTICIGSSGTITASGATSYTWNTGSNAASIVISPTTTTNYTVNGTSGTCNGTNTISIAVSANPTVTATSSSSVICTGNSATLNATGATSYNWNPGSLSGTSVVVSPTINTTYTVVGSNAAGCTNTKTISVTVSTCSGISELSSDKSINIYPNPNNGEFTLIVPEHGVYSIINSIGQTVDVIEVKENTQTINVNGLADGIYYVIGKTSRAKIVVSK